MDILSLRNVSEMGEIEELTRQIKEFRDRRNWLQFHNHKDMAISLVLEATELLELFQWKSPEEVVKDGRNLKKEISEEIADIAIYLLELADNLEIDISKAIENKLKKNAEKYPTDKAWGKHTKYNKL